MTRRIIIAILLTVGAMLLFSDAITYWTVRSVLLDELDRSILARIALLPQIAAADGMRGGVVRDPSDRYVIESAAGRNLARSGPPPATSAEGPRIINARFSSVASGERFRTLTVLAVAHSGEGTEPVTVVYSGSAARLDALLNRLIGALLAANALVVAVAGITVRRVSASALQPLSHVVETIGTIDESKLDRRINTAELPSELAPVAERLNDMLGRLEETSGRRRRFIADASHELRAPVAALMTTLEVCTRRRRAADEYEGVLHDCLANTRLLRELVDALMEQVRGETYATEAAVEPVDIKALLAPCIEVARALGKPREIAVAAEIGDMPVLLTAPERLRSITINLLSNAVEYNKDGGRVELRVQYAHPGANRISFEQSLQSASVPLSASEEDAWLTLEVSDTGVGIPPEELARVSEPFYRIDKTRKPGAGHLGLGLFLVKTHVDGLRGTLSMESHLNQGTAIRIRIPARAAQGNEGPERTAETVPPEGGSAGP